MTVNTLIYNNRFFKNTIKLEQSTAKITAKILIKHFHPKSVIDIGCGAGVYLKEFQRQRIIILGYDGSLAAKKNSLVGQKIKLHDLCQPLKLRQRFDLCLCLEVAEHLPAKCANTLIKTLCHLANTIIFTAATPGQGPISIGHINEQLHQYWIKKFKEQDFNLNKTLTKKIKQEMKKQQVIWWLSKNLMIFQKHV